jgi:hypothetical protein
MQTLFRPNHIQTLENYYYYFGEKKTETTELMFEKMNEYTDNTPRDYLVSFII